LEAGHSKSWGEDDWNELVDGTQAGSMVDLAKQADPVSSLDIDGPPTATRVD